jgi:hypothetical protein
MGGKPFSLWASELDDRLGTAAAPTVIGVRAGPAFAHEPIVTAVRETHNWLAKPRVSVRDAP